MDKNMACSIIVLWTILYTALFATAKHDHWCSPNMIPSGNCGIHLDELLASTCGDGNFYSPDFSLSSTQDSMYQENNMLLGLMGKRDANIYLKKRRNYYYQGVVCECCINQCTINELRTYCSVPVRNDIPY